MSKEDDDVKNRIISQLLKYLMTDNVNVEYLIDCFEKSGLSINQISSIIWTVIDLAKSNGTFSEEASDKMCLFAATYAEKSNDLNSLLLLTQDKADIKKMCLKGHDQFDKQHTFYVRSKYKIPKYQYLQTNTEGYARLLADIAQNNPSDITPIIGQHNLDPDAVLMLIIEMMSRTENPPLFDLLHNFPLDRVLQIILPRVGKNNQPGLDALLLFLFDNGLIPLGQNWPLINRLNTILEDATKAFCIELRKPKTILPSFPKEDQLPAIFKEKREKYYRSKAYFIKTPQFKDLLADLNPNSIISLAKFDPCSVAQVAKYTTNYLMESYKSNPNSFFSNQQNLDLLVLLNGQCTDIHLFYDLCSDQNTPPALFSYFILPYVSTSKLGWQISFPVHEALKRFSFSSRIKIYQKYSEVMNQYSDLKILSSGVQGQIINITKRLSLESAPKYALKISKLFCKAPIIVAEAILKNLFDNDLPSEVSVDAIKDISPLSLDILLWIITKHITNKTVTKGTPPKNVSVWPQTLAIFLGIVAKNRIQDLDMKSLLTFILNGLNRSEVPHACLLSYLIKNISGVQYRLTKDYIEKKSGDSLLQLLRRHINDDVQFTSDSLKRYLSEGDLGVQILRGLDNLHTSVSFINVIDNEEQSASDILDDIKYIFLTLCEFLEFEEIGPLSLVKEYGFSVHSAYHIALHKGGSDTESLSPKGMPSTLFAAFWNHDVKDFHVPEQEFKSLINEIEQKISGNEKLEDEKSIQEFMIKDKLNICFENQKKRKLEIEEELKEIGANWFEDKNVYDLFVQFCIIPRVMSSQFDAYYSACFIFSIAHFSDCCLATFVETYLQFLHFIVFSATYEETKSLGMFTMKLLKYIGLRSETEKIHDLLLEKIMLLLQREETFALGNTVSLLDSIVKYFPKSAEHKEKIKTTLKSLDIPPQSAVEQRIKGYINKLKEKKAPPPEPVPEPEPPKKEVTISRSASSNNMPKSQSKPNLQSSSAKTNDKQIKSTKPNDDNEYSRTSRPSSRSDKNDYHSQYKNEKPGNNNRYRSDKR